MARRMGIMARPSFVLRRVLLALSVAAVGCTSSPPRCGDDRAGTAGEDARFLRRGIDAERGGFRRVGEVVGIDEAGRPAAGAAQVEDRRTVIDIETACRRDIGCDRLRQRGKPGAVDPRRRAIERVDRERPGEQRAGRGEPGQSAREQRRERDERRQQQRQRVVRIIIADHRETGRRRREPEPQERAVGRWPAAYRRGRQRDEQRHRDDREIAQIVGDGGRRQGAAPEDRGEVGEPEGVEMAQGGIAADRHQRRCQRDRDHRHRTAGDRLRSQAARPQPPQEPAAERHAFRQMDIFDLQREPARGHRAEPEPQDRARIGGVARAHRGERGERGQQVVEDRALPAGAAERQQPEQIAEPRGKGRRGRRGAAREEMHQGRSRPRAQRRGELIGDDGTAAEHSCRGIDQEQADRLAVPQIDIGQQAVPQPVADQQIELLVIIDRRIAEPRPADRERRCQQQRAGQPARPGRDRSAGRRGRSGQGTGSPRDRSGAGSPGSVIARSW